MCDAKKSDGWVTYTNPPKEMIAVLGKQKPDRGKIILFKNADGRTRYCNVYPEQGCAGSYFTVDAATAPKKDAATAPKKIDGLMISSCPNIR
jgi:hypothetical protein